MHTPSGDEKEAWSDDDTDTETNKEVQSNQNADAPPKLTFKPAKDGYSSGDLGDVSQYYATEVPDEKDRDARNEATPRKPHKKRRTPASKDITKPSLDKPVMGASVTMETVATATESKVVKEGSPPSNEANELPSEDLVDRVLEAIWGYCHAYHISNSVSALIKPLLRGCPHWTKFILTMSFLAGTDVVCNG